MEPSSYSIQTHAFLIWYISIHHKTKLLLQSCLNNFFLKSYGSHLKSYFSFHNTGEESYKIVIYQFKLSVCHQQKKQQFVFKTINYNNKESFKMHVAILSRFGV